MRTVALDFWPQIHEDVRAACGRLGLAVEQLNLRSAPTAVHFHIAKPSLRGVLEFTADADKREARFSVHDNREGEWIDGAIAGLLTLIAR